MRSEVTAGPGDARAESIDAALIDLVAGRIAGYVRRTPVLSIDGASLGLASVTVHLKLEVHQLGGSFKARGAFANLLLRPTPGAGVVAASGGSHGVAVAAAAQRLQLPARIFVPNIASPVKVARIRASGALLEVAGATYADALAASEAWCDEHDAMAVHAFDAVETIAGQGTVGAELVQQCTFDTVLVPVGGGGLIAGIATAVAGRARVVGVEPDLSPTLHRALAAGEPVTAPVGGIAAEALAPAQVGRLTFAMLRPLIDEVVLVSDAAILRAQTALWHVARVIAEPAGATALAALLTGAYRPRPHERVAVIVSGGNTSDLTFTTLPFDLVERST